MRDSRWKVSPNAVVYSVAALLIAASAFARYVLTNRTHAIDPLVTMDSATPIGEKPPQRSQPQPAITVMEGEVARTAERVSEATALAMAASLYVATTAIKGDQPRDVGDLLARLRTHNLLPPGLAIGRDSGSLVSDRGILFVRYRPRPLGIEVVSTGHDRIDGPAIIVRVPDEVASNYSRLFIATRLNSPLPPAFAPAAEVIAAGWSPEPLRSLR